MEKDNELKGEGNSYTTDWRQYEPRVGRWLTIDPAVKSFPNISPYANNLNNPISHTDPNGDCPDGNCGDEQLVAANKIVAKHFDPNKNRKDISQAIFNDIVALASTKEGQELFPKAGDLEAFMGLTESIWEETFFSDFLGGSKHKEYNDAINGAANDSEKADIIMQRSAHMRSEMAKMELVATGLTEWFMGMVGSSNYNFFKGSSRTFTIPRSGPINKNSNSYVGHQGVYQILIDGKLYKYGKADMTKISSTGNPTRLQNQLNSLKKQFPNSDIEGSVIFEQNIISTRAIKAIETQNIQQYYNTYKALPPGNPNHPGIVK